MPSRGPQLINVTRLTDTQILAHWKPLSIEIARGFITHFTLSAQPITRLRQNGVISVSVSPSDHHAMLENLDPNQAYIVTVSASTVVGSSSENEMRPVGTFSIPTGMILIYTVKALKSSCICILTHS